MSGNRSIAVVFLAIAIVGWVAAIVTHQGERYYDKKGPDAAAWYWLRLFGIPTTRKNCGRFVSATYVLAIAVCAIVIAVLVFRQ